MAGDVAPVLAACTGCGLIVPGGDEGCLALYRATLGLGTGDRRAFDAYCVQHPARYCASAKSLAAHLGGLCWAIEHGGGPRGYAALNRFLDGPARFPKPPLPAARGALSIGDVAAADAGAARARALDAWIASVWAAYVVLHPQARRWVAAALARRR